jgi:isocitrate/methylisocitrate lyase
MDQAIARGLAYAPYADLIWCETGTPDLEEAERFASAIHAEFPDRMLAYNCSPSFNWKHTLSDEEITGFHELLAELGYRFQFITLAGFHTLNHSMFELAYGYRREGMPAYARLQEAEFASEERGYTATQHQREVGAGWFDEVAQLIAGGDVETTALAGSTERASSVSRDPPSWRAFPRRRPSQTPTASGARVSPRERAGGGWRRYSGEETPSGRWIQA